MIFNYDIVFMGVCTPNFALIKYISWGNIFEHIKILEKV